jgi:hypothetical protein
VATASFAAATRRKTDTANLFRTIGLPSTDRPTVRGSPEFRASVSHRSLEFKGEDGWGFYAEASGSSAFGSKCMEENCTDRSSVCLEPSQLFD